MTMPTKLPEAEASSFNIVTAYHSHLSSTPSLPHPIAAINALCDLLSHPSTTPSTVSELITLISTHSSLLQSSLPNPIPAKAGTDLFSRFVISMDWRGGGGGFQDQRRRLVGLAREFCEKTVPDCRRRICQRANVFLREGAVVLTHSYSRVVMQLLKEASALYRNTLSIYVTESRPGGLGIKTYNELTEAGISATLVLDAAAAYVLSRVDVVLVGAEGVAESGGVLNAVGTYQIGLLAKSLAKPFYVAAESYKFLRIFPLSPDDLPSTHPILPFQPPRSNPSTTKPQSISDSSPRADKIMSPAAEELNPVVDYTPPTLITAIVSDVGTLTPAGVADALLMTYGGAD